MPGSRRRSTMAVVIDSAMRRVASAGAGVPAPLRRRKAGDRMTRSWAVERGMSIGVGTQSVYTFAMPQLTTHALDTAHGCPAAGLGLSLLRLGEGGSAEMLKTLALDADGRGGGPLLEGAACTPGRYRLVFAVAAYFAGRGVAQDDPPFLGEVVIDFGIAPGQAHYHVPLLVSPWSYATYRGS